VREKNKLLSKSISWSIEPKYAIKKQLRVPKLAGGGQAGWEFSPSFTVFFKASLTNSSYTSKCFSAPTPAVTPNAAKPTPVIPPNAAKPNPPIPPRMK